MNLTYFRLKMRGNVKKNNLVKGRLPQATLMTTSLKRQQSHKTSHKTQAKITWCLVTIRGNPMHPQLSAGAGSI